MRILLACGAGLSTSILMKKMEKYCEDKGEDLKIEAVPVGNVEGYQDEYDCILIGPQDSSSRNSTTGLCCWKCRKCYEVGA